MHDFSVGLLGDCSSLIVARYYDEMPVSVAHLGEHTELVGVFKQNAVPLRHKVVSPL